MFPAAVGQDGGGFRQSVGEGFARFAEERLAAGDRRGNVRKDATGIRGREEAVADGEVAEERVLAPGLAA